MAAKDSFHSSSEGSPEYFFSTLVIKVRLGLIVTVLGGVSKFSELIMKELQNDVLEQ